MKHPKFFAICLSFVVIALVVVGLLYIINEDEVSDIDPQVFEFKTPVSRV